MIITQLFYLLIFPGFLFLLLMSLVYEFYDRKLYARLQNRVGPPWFQPVADLIKLIGKEDIVPVDADPAMFTLMPVFALTGVVTAFMYIPIWGKQALFSFSGDIIVVVYLMTIPTLSFFLGGWYSTSLYSMIGAIRSQIQFFSYEVPMFLAILAPAMLANTWSLSGMCEFYASHPGYWLFNILGFGVSLVALLGKLEKVPFDAPEAETEIVAGTFTEYSGRLLAYFKIAIDIELVVGASLIAAVFLPFGLSLGPVAGFFLYLLKITFIISLLTIARTLFARLRIDQIIDFCWVYLAPVALLQVLISLVLKGAIGL